MGDGAFSNVYKALERKTGRKVAVKVVRKYELNSSQVRIVSFYLLSLVCSLLPSCRLPCAGHAWDQGGKRDIPFLFFAPSFHCEYFEADSIGGSLALPLSLDSRLTWSL